MSMIGSPASDPKPLPESALPQLDSGIPLKTVTDAPDNEPPHDQLLSETPLPGFVCILWYNIAIQMSNSHKTFFE